MERGIAQLAVRAVSLVDPRYRPSPWLRRRGVIGLSLLHEEE